MLVSRDFAGEELVDVVVDHQVLTHRRITFSVLTIAADFPLAISENARFHCAASCLKWLSRAIRARTRAKVVLKCRG